MKTIIVCLFALLSLQVFAQKGKIKKGIVTIDGNEFLRINKDYGNEIISTPQGVEIMKVEYQYYEVPNPARNNTNDPHRYNSPATTRRGYAIVKFLPFETVFETDMGMVRL